MWPGSSPSAVVNGAAGMIIAALVVVALYAGRDLFMPFALAGLLGFVLAPPVRRLTNWGLPNGLSVALVIVLLLGSLFAGATVVGRQLTQLLEDLPTHVANLRAKARFVHLELGGTGIWQRAIATVRRIEEEVRDPQADKPLKIEVAQGTDDPLVTIFEYTRVSVPSLMSAVLVLLLTISRAFPYRRTAGAGVFGIEARPAGHRSSLNATPFSEKGGQVESALTVFGIVALTAPPLSP